MSAAWYIAGMKKKPLTVNEFARMGGKARAQKLSPERRRQIASEAGKKGGRPRKVTLRESPLTTGSSLKSRTDRLDINLQAS
jgi:general stress protein YciG